MAAMGETVFLRDAPANGSAAVLGVAPRRGAAGPEAIRRALPVYDAAVALAAGVSAHVLSTGWSPRSVVDVLATAVVAPLVWIGIFQFFRTYARAGVTPGEQIRRVVGATATASLALAAITGWADVPTTLSSVSSLFVAAAILELLGRWGARFLAARTARTGGARVPTLVIGTNAEARRLAGALSSNQRHAPVGFVGRPADRSDDDPPIVAGVPETENVLRTTGVRCVYVASSALTADEIETVARACRRTGAELHITTNVSGIHPSRLVVRSDDGVTAIAVRPVRLSGGQAAAKRAFDVVVGSAALVVALPLIGVIAAAIRLTSPGPAVFRQTRVTKDGRPFTMYKLRSMVVDPERALDGSLIDLTKPFFKLEDDPRLTRVGRIIRSLSLDELPQLWNVVRGDMSLIGPRPLPAEQVAANAEFLAPRHEVRGGLTGLWQVSGRSELDSEDALRIDMHYIENWSIGLDIWILYRTLGAVLARRGAV
jgi:exopolysaccharide biosynthesis polyprenyl glycosylphosphotransferase